LSHQLVEHLEGIAALRLHAYAVGRRIALRATASAPSDESTHSASRAPCFSAVIAQAPA
jgi:hypothetical protein